MANRIVHFEIEAKDKDRAKEFYSKAFGWEMEVQGPEMGGYIVVKTGENTGKMEDIGINGGIYQEEQKKLNAFSCVVGVDDVQKAIADVRAAGGKVDEHNMTPDGHDMGEVMDIPTIGKYAKCEDTEGNRFTLLQPDLSSMPQA
ncbi:MAG TPA: VOC family protein [Candidatus Limnocylindrales bacterium]|nr:VOC family protein [Candidatus Limnocylindrales bacterium]